ncbi:beta-agarase [Thalassobellus suaedae]|uniref:Beta-agarase n=1 Tax=Thalassobellus suaedae TaxID=3074124 RepID=A0ABY9Y1G1_9FLAO|nr:beta-agarase [Flavobacteriaceae bacterium HL-DH10]
MNKLFITLTISIVSLYSVVAQENEVTIDFTTQKFIGNESELNRQKYFAMHDSYASWDLASDADYLFKKLGIEHGRAFGGPAPFRKSKTEIPSLAEAKAMADRAAEGLKKSPLFDEFATSDFIITDHPSEAFQLNQNYDKVAEYDATYLKNAYPVIPKYYEVMNEPFVHAKDYVETWGETPAVIIEMSKLYKTVADKVHSEIPDMMVGGYASAYPEVEKDDFGYWDTRMKTFMDVAGESMQFFATHIYDGRNVEGDFSYRSGSNSEGILDLIEAYSFKKWGVVKPHVISEYGYTAQGLVGKPYSPELNGTCLIAYNKILMQLLDKPDRLLKAIPFITSKATWFYDNKEGNPNGYPYPWVIKKKEEDGSYTFTHLKKFYELWKGVEGKRIEVASNNPDIQIHGFSKEGKVFIAINNLSDENQDVVLNFLNNSTDYIKNITLRRLYTTATGFPRLIYFTNESSIDSVKLKPGETIIAECDVTPIIFNNTLKENNYYTDTYLQPIEKNKTITFNFKNIEAVKNGRAYIKMGIGRSHDMSKKPTITLNGKTIEVPNNWAGYDQLARQRFFGVIGIPIDNKLLIAGENSVKITFPDSGGHVSSVIINVESRG